MTPCPNCHSTEYTLQSGARSGKPVSLLRRLFGGGQADATSSGRRRCNFCGTVYSAEDEVDDDDQRLEERRARMKERMSGFRDSTATSSLFPEGAGDSQPALPDERPPGKTPPKPFLTPTLEELSLVAAGIEMQQPEGVKCRKCGHFAFLVRTPESTCAGCGRVYAKMDEEAEAERQEAIRKAEAGGKG